MKERRGRACAASGTRKGSTTETDASPTWTVAADGAIYELFVMDEVLFWRTQGEDTLTRSELDAQTFADLFG